MANPYLEIQGLTKRIGHRVLFENISFTVNEREHIGLIAKNGTGKSTLLSIIAGKESDDGGKMVFRNGIKVGYLEQSPTIDAHGSEDENDEFQLLYKQYLTQMKITEDEAKRPASQLSGGQVKRIALSRVLAKRPDLLILDEPTNHLDLEMIEWLENTLSHSTMSILMVTHDRYFLDRICSSIIEMDNSRIYPYKGNYSYYLEKRQERIDNMNAEIARANNLYRTELEWMRSTPCARSSKARYRIESFYELEKVAKQRIEERSVKLEMGGTYIGNKIFEMQNVCKAFGNQTILNDFSYNFTRYEKMGIVGNNGTGKSTFVKMLLGLEPHDSGSIDIGKTVRFGYYSQQGMAFREDQKVIDAVRDIAEYVDMGNGEKLSAGQFLQHFLFSPEEQFSYIYKLSGGERRRLYLCTVLMKAPNFLILDEPTNDLDIVTLQILEDYLKSFRGCLIIVSHDRYFMDRVVDHTLVFHGNGQVQDFPGSYSQYRDWKEQNKQESSKLQNKDSRKDSNRNVNRARKLTFKEKQEYTQLEKDIAKLEEEKKQIEAALCGGTTSIDEITALSKRLPILTEELEEKEMRWLELSELS
ncbi:MAG: ABC-F family ATP-binding cassette domain-containing protein [Bacteroidaceae bacterium]|jgi:ATP-binding cassette subfamily F protein uup|nr:ABC-F family ATP-binding cassette domain-containing protein [Bacteroidaceae bacterium]